MESDLLSFFQDRMARAYAEQVWAVLLVGSMNGFVIKEARTLLDALKSALVVWGIRIITGLALLFIWSRHAIFLHYDGLAKQILALHSPAVSTGLSNFQQVGAITVGWSGVALYTLLVVGMAYAACRTLKTQEQRDGACSGASPGHP